VKRIERKLSGFSSMADPWFSCAVDAGGMFSADAAQA
jgi:hypothetical protein